ncbi:uncharacterized protein LOC127856092 [Dreissena polymorpha]|uniref:uncharacterized protein LOC127856092 n=1 Tax=Dreissena polymorpha TaxID=45954 RepID=UPI002263B20A|nr:uncharacterized protein LOC127856092 [Dreissena polymorpha]
MFMLKSRVENNEKDKLFNCLVRLFQEKQWGFTQEQADTTGKMVVGKLVNCLWYFDPFWDRLKTRGITPPDVFQPFTGCRRLKEQKKKIPQLNTVELQENIESISDILMLPWIENPSSAGLKKIMDLLITDLSKYHKFMTGMQKCSNNNHQSPEPIRNFNDSWTLVTVTK